MNAIPEGGIDAESEDVPKKQVKVKVEPEEVIVAEEPQEEPAEPESDVDSVDDDTEETQVLDAALKTLPKIK